MNSITARIDAVTLVREEAKTVTPPAPRSVKIELTNRCNLRCGFCALRMREEQTNTDIDWQHFKRITREMREAGVEEIGVFYLGESFTAPRLLVDAIRYLKREIEMPYVFLTTNGTLAFPHRVEECMRAGLDSLKFSINAADEEQYEQVMGAPAKLMRQALSNLRDARAIRDAYGFKCGIYASSIRYDGEQQQRMQSLMNKHVLPYCDEVYELPLYSMGSLATQREEELGYRPTAGNQGRLGALREPLPCWSLWEGHVRTNARGEPILSLCCFGADDRFDVGNLAEMSFMDAWHSEMFQKARAAHIAKDVTGSVCEQCVAYQG